jgi:malto-oligosyltrehalose synthase/4-alpha-glucanotransferase
MFDPVCTYRLQFHKGFTFNDFKAILPYLQDIGVKTIYASPIFAAVPDSNHGYDVTDPHRINPEIGTLDELVAISGKLKEAGMNWLQDIVPNHMAFHPENAWLMDVLKYGRDSAYANHFDILWDVPPFHGRLMVPFLGSPLPDLIKNGEVKLSYISGNLALTYAGQSYPVNDVACLKLLKGAMMVVPAELQQAIAVIEGDGKNGHSAVDLEKLIAHPALQAYLEGAVAAVNADPQRLQELADDQYYRLCYWKESDTAINYRRFFTVNGLICLNMQHQAVFDDYHRLIKELLEKGIFQGLRVDHIDGLYDPKTYVERLRALAGPEIYIVVEKILESGEGFPAEWPVQGNTGYDFLAQVNNLLTSPKSKRAFTDFYREIATNAVAINKAIPQKKAAILYQHMAGELANLERLFTELSLAEPGQLRALEKGTLKTAIAEFLIRCPVYRYYGNTFPLLRAEAKALAAILGEIEQDKPELAPAVSLISKVFIGRAQGQARRAAALNFYQRCMQFTGPLMAKGVEDTLMYTYDRFIGHNEVGDSPAEFGLTMAKFHDLMAERQARWPYSINATATHDTKRGEDVRAKLNVLTDLPEEWLALVGSWQRVHQKSKIGHAPDANDTYLIYQTLAGAAGFPDQEQDQLAERMAAYLTKALREAKVHTQWAEPNEDYETAAQEFTKQLLKPTGKFWQDLQNWQSRIADHFILNSLVQVLLKFTCPGIPDVYQGCELWDLSLVDPDNRRPVDFQLRQQLLSTVRSSSLANLWDTRRDGSLKLWLTDKLLHERGAHPGIFATGAYLPLTVKGKYRYHLIAFARRHLRQWLVVVAPLHLAGVTAAPFPEFNWEDTAVVLPDDAPLEWNNELTGDHGVFSGLIPLTNLLKSFPLALLTSASSTTRRAGIIMHITSLPSPYGIGDLGPEARKFADFLADAGQRYWQLLPVNPTESASGYSPYSAYSGMAGHTLLISPDDLMKEGLLTQAELEGNDLTETNAVDFDGALTLKTKMFDLAFNRFNTSASETLRSAFYHFKDIDSAWLYDCSLYEVLKLHHGGKPWYEWDVPLKLRQKHEISQYISAHEREIERSKWLQFVFCRQWSALKAHGNALGLHFFGDLPFYISYDSADVWTHPDIFKLDEQKNMLSSAGVPPDYFNADGQLWGMPVYRWEVLKNSGYAWWVQRMKKNRAFFDVVRLDHFRAFYDYWEVPAAEKTAVNGQWRPGPGTDIFEVFRQELGELPFIAEDLGDVNAGVYQLRDKIGLPGMNLLQYGFGDDMPVSVHVPHNHLTNSVTYTGTHDNNTTLGWFQTDAGITEKRNLAAYLRTRVNSRNVSRLLVETCYSSVARIAIVPLQDLLGLDGRARMNMPSSAAGNWHWRVSRSWPAEKMAYRLRLLVKLFYR